MKTLREDIMSMLSEFIEMNKDIIKEQRNDSVSSAMVTLRSHVAIDATSRITMKLHTILNKHNQ